MNIFLLCAGKGSRFDSIYPKPLNLINGKPMIYYTIKSLNLDKVLKFKLFIIYNKRLDSCNFKQIIINMFPLISFHFILIDYITRGASESAYIGLLNVFDQIDNNNIIFFDNDTIYPENTHEYLNNNYDSNFILTNFNHEKDAIYSYVSINKDNLIIDIKEKQKISNLICIGGYGFKNKYEFRDVFKLILDENKKTMNEFYMSLIYDFLLKNKKDVLNITINQIISLGTPKQLINDYLLSSSSVQYSKLRYVFDLDNTLVTYPVIPKDYTSVLPIKKMIDLVKHLKNKGHYIIIYTARRMATHSHNVGAVIKDIGRITFDTLEKFNIPYDELVFGKPLGDIYIDDRAYNPYDERIYKLIGEYELINDEVENKIQNNKFNEIKCIDEKIIKKVDKHIGKGELYFYENLDKLGELQKYFVQYNGYTLNNQIELNLEKINGIPISYLYINKTYSLKLFKKLLESLKEIHSIKLDNLLDIDEYKNNYILVLKNRYQNKSNYNFEGSDELYKILVEKLNIYFDNVSNNISHNITSVIHGDFWFSNILLSFKDEYKFIDMKGLICTTETLSGDKVYDYAKILQSLIGFDSILYDKEIDINYNQIFIDYFKEWIHVNEKIDFDDINTVCARLIFGVFHAYKDMSIEKRNKIIDLVRGLI